METRDDAVEMRVKGLMLDPASNTPVILLHDPAKKLLLPIWIGVFEANAIALRIEGVEPPRPLTHDLLFASLSALGGTVQKVTISELRDNTFYAEISLLGPDGPQQVDSRPSDAIALALRADAPIFALSSVLESARTNELAQRISDEERLKKWLEEADPETFGKYEM